MADQLHFGTDGIRGNAAKFPFTSNALYAIGRAIVHWHKNKFSSPSCSILLGHDTRISCTSVKQYLCTGLLHESATVTDAGVVPTPTILHLMKYNQTFDLGIIISASHNPFTDNGIKIVDRRGKLEAQDEQTIIAFFRELSAEPQCSPTTHQVKISSSWGTDYTTIIHKHFPTLNLTGKKIILDCAHGATFSVAPAIFQALGAITIPLHNTPNGTNINYHCGALHPEILQKTVLQENADIGFAFDGDGDRVIAVSKHGIIKDGDDLLCLLLQHPDFAQESTIVGTVMTNYGFEAYINSHKKNLVRTNVGDKYIAAYLDQNNLMLGGEASGHIIMRQYLSSGDGILVALKTLEAIILMNNWEMITFKKMPQIIINIAVACKKRLDQPPYNLIIQEYESKLVQGRIVVRYSGTENLLRVMVEDQTELAAKSLAQELGMQLKAALNK